MSDLATTADTTTTAAPVPPVEAPPPKPTDPPTKPPSDKSGKGAKASADMDRAFMALNRKEKKIDSDRKALFQEREAFRTEREQLEAKAKLAEELQTKLARLRDDEAIQKELLGEDFYERATRSRLDPEATERDRKAQEALKLRDDKIAALEKKINEITEGQQKKESEARQAEARRHNLAGLEKAVDELGDPALHLYSLDELLDAAPAAVVELKKEMAEDEWPTFRQIAEFLAKEAQPRYQRATEAEKKRANRAAEQGAPPAKKEPKEPSTVTTDAATKSAGKPRALSKEEQEAADDAAYLEELWRKEAEERKKKSS